MIEKKRSLIISPPKNIGPVIPREDAIEPGELLWKLSRGRKIIFGIVIIVMALTGIVLSQVTSRYTANALIMINNIRNNIVQFESVIAGISLDNDTIASEIEILKSRGLAAKVVASLVLSDNPEFNIALKPQGNIAGFIQRREYIPENWRNALWPETGEAADDNNGTAERTRVIDKFMEGLTVSRRGNSHMIEVTYTSEAPKISAKVANTLVEIYLSQQLDTKFGATRDATKWLTERVEPLRKKVVASDTAIERYRQKSGLSESQGLTLNSQQIAELNIKLILAQSDYMEAQMRLRNINTLAEKPDGIEAAPEVLKSALIQRLREQEAGLQRKQGELSTELGKLHPTMIQLRAELDDLQNKIKVEIDKVVSSIKSEAEIAGVRKESLETSFNKLKKQEVGINAARVKLHALQREAEADRNVLETLLARLKEISLQENMDIYQPDARVISAAEIPLEPTYPMTVPILALMLFASTLTGILVLFVRESMDNGFYRSEEIELQTGLPSLGYLQNIRSGWIGGNPGSRVLEKFGPAFSESISRLYTNLLLASSSNHPKIILVTSAESGEGKTTTAACLARTRALAGNKTIIVDLNFRKPSLHTVFGIPRSPGILDLLAGDSTLKQVVYNDPVSGADVIPSGDVCPSPTDILIGPGLDKQIRSLAGKYDLVIFDSAAILAVPDTRLLLDKVDTTVFVVRWVKTKRKIVRKALAQLMQSKEHYVGVVLNRVVEKKYF